MTTLDNKINFKKVAELWIKKKETSTKDSTYIHYYNQKSFFYRNFSFFRGVNACQVDKIVLK